MGTNRREMSDTERNAAIADVFRTINKGMSKELREESEKELNSIVKMLDKIYSYEDTTTKS